MAEVLQKLLTGAQASAIVENGHDQVGGVVARAGDLAGLRTPQAVLAAHGIEGAPEFVDVVRFAMPRLSQPQPLEGTFAEATFPHGFLLGDSLAPAWLLRRTRYSYGSEYWRLRADGEQKHLSTYQGAARGWVGARGWRPPSALVGTRARWSGGEHPADVFEDSALITVFGDAAPPGFEQIRPNAWAGAVPLGDCEIFETVLTATVDTVPVRVIASGGGTVVVDVHGNDVEAAARIGAQRVEIGVHEAHLPQDRLADIQGVENTLIP